MLKTTNYNFKGYVLPEVFAKVEVDTEKNKAIFKLGFSREMIDNGEWIETKEQRIDWDRKSDPVVLAYNTAKGKKELEVENVITGKKEMITRYGILYGWDDDYATE